MKSITLLKMITAGLLILLLVAGVGYATLSQLKNNARAIVEDTLPGLSYAGEANAYMADASRTLLLIVTENPDRRNQLKLEIIDLSARTTEYLQKYQQQIFSPEDRANFEAVLAARTNYITLRDQVIELATSGKKENALTMFNDSLVPAQRTVKKAGDKLLEYNMEQGRNRGRKIMTICTMTQFGVALFSVLAFVTGFFIGLFK
jgi:hypothetical protein